ncbi:hypothetical protein JCM11491_001091 [Sporobolomyces phaffii]
MIASSLPGPPFAPPSPGLPPFPPEPSSPLAGFTPGDLSHAEVFRRYSITWFCIALFDTLATCPGDHEHILTPMWNAKFTPVQGLFLIKLVFMLIAQLCLQIGPAAQLRRPSPSSAKLNSRTRDVQHSWLQLLLIAAVVPPPELKAILHLPGCGAATKGRLSGGTDTLFWIASLAFDSSILGLTLYRSITVTKRAGFKLPIVRRLVRDGLFYFAVITSSNIVSVVFVTQTANLFLRPFQAPASLALLSLMSAVSTQAHIGHADSNFEELPTAVPLRTLGALDFESGSPSSIGFAHPQLKSAASCSTLKSCTIEGVRVQRSTVVTHSD